MILVIYVINDISNMKQRHFIFFEDKAVQHRNIRLLEYNFGIKSFGVLWQFQTYWNEANYMHQYW